MNIRAIILEESYNKLKRENIIKLIIKIRNYEEENRLPSMSIIVLGGRSSRVFKLLAQKYTVYVLQKPVKAMILMSILSNLALKDCLTPLRQQSYEFYLSKRTMVSPESPFGPTTRLADITERTAKPIKMHSLFDPSNKRSTSFTGQTANMNSTSQRNSNTGCIEEIKQNKPSTFGDFVSRIQKDPTFKFSQMPQSARLHDSSSGREANRIGKTVHMFTNSSMRDVIKKHKRENRVGPSNLNQIPSLKELKNRAKLCDLSRNKNEQKIMGSLLKELNFGYSFRNPKQLKKKELGDENDVEEVKDISNFDKSEVQDGVIQPENSKLIDYKFIKAIPRNKILLVEDQAMSGISHTKH